MNKQIRTLHPEIKIIDAKAGIVDYVASDETIDSYGEVIRASGWRFTHFQKNAPFVDSHNYNCIDKLLGKVIDFRIEGGRLTERVQWAIDVPENELARIGWKMTEAGYLKAVSVGFYPLRGVGPNSGDRAEYLTQLKEMGISEKNGPRFIFIEQEQIELSACIIGANPNALAKAYKAGALDEQDLTSLENFFLEKERQAKSLAPTNPAEGAAQAERRGMSEFAEKLTNLIKGE